MTRRNAEWHLVGRDSDPVPADRFDVDDVAADFTARGAVMDEAAATLKAFSDLEEWTGEAAVKFADKASEAHSDLNKAGEKYTDAGAALATFADRINEARLDTWRALQDAIAADSDKRANADSLLDGVDDPSDELQDADDQRSDDYDAADSALTKARQDLQTAMDTLDAEANNCAARINRASEKFKDSRMDNVRGFVAAAVDVLGVIAIIIVAVVIVLLIVATAGGFLGALLAGSLFAGLLTAGTVVGSMILGLTLVQFLILDDATLGDVGLATLGVIGGPLGKIAGKLAAPALARLAPAARTAITASTRGSTPYQLNALGSNLARGVPLLGNRFPLRDIAAGLDSANVNMIDDAVGVFDTTLSTLPRAGGLSRLMGTDGLVNTFRQVQLFKGVDGLVIDAPTLTALNRAMGIEGVASVATVAGQGNDVAGFPESLSNTIDNIANFNDTITIEAPTRPTTVVPVGR
ncbi:hypothetical protein [Aeromicrobium sp. CF3.5]|uniref:hypothetical protein n=1 Tax=Aeromicrobium sp. CF3.5 TaxID=3373078 RepID=UPI003EE65164